MLSDGHLVWGGIPHGARSFEFSNVGHLWCEWHWPSDVHVVASSSGRGEYNRGYVFAVTCT